MLRKHLLNIRKFKLLFESIEDAEQVRNSIDPNEISSIYDKYKHKDREDPKYLNHQDVIHAIAEHPMTPSDVLLDLHAAHVQNIWNQNTGSYEYKPNLDVTKRLAKNPNAFPGSLAELSRFHPDEIDQNPGMQLAALENPDNAHLEPEIAKVSASKLVHALAIGSSDSDVHRGLILNPHISPEIVEKLSNVGKDPNFYYDLQNYQADKMTPEVRKSIQHRKFENPATEIEHRIMQFYSSHTNNNLSSDTLHAYWNDLKNEHDLHKNDSKLHALIIELLQRVGSHFETSPVTLQDMYVHKGKYRHAVDKSLALNRNTPPEILDKIFNDHAPNIPTYVNDNEIIENLSGNENISQKLVKKLIDFGGFYRNVLARNPRLSTQSLLKLIHPHLDHREKNNVIFNLFKNPKLPPQVLDWLATNGDHDTKMKVIDHPKTKIETLHRLAQDDSYGGSVYAQAKLQDRLRKKK